MDSAIDDSNPSSAAVFRGIVALILLLWSSVIGPEAPGELWDGPVAQVPSESTPTGSGKKLPQKKLGSKEAAMVDREAFLASYKRQARPMLDACLQSWMPSPGQATFVAVLHKKTGRLSNLELIGSNKELPGCVVNQTYEMDFTAIVEMMEGENVVLQWTADW